MVNQEVLRKNKWEFPSSLLDMSGYIHYFTLQKSLEADNAITFVACLL